MDYAVDPAGAVLGSVDHEGKITEISVDASGLFEVDPSSLVGQPLMELFRQDDAATVRVLLSRASFSGRTSIAEVRAAARSEEEHQRLLLTVSVLRSQDGARIAFAVSEVAEPESAHDECRATEGRYELHLRRIATEIRSAGLHDAPTLNGGREDGLMRLMRVEQFSARQVEIVRRLLRGQRVSTIAKSLYLSESTVRNHLCSVYRKLGVHSQIELLEMLSATAEDES